MYKDVQVLREAGCREQPDRDNPGIAASIAAPTIWPLPNPTPESRLAKLVRRPSRRPP